MAALLPLHFWYTSSQCDGGSQRSEVLKSCEGGMFRGAVVCVVGVIEGGLAVDTRHGLVTQHEGALCRRGRRRRRRRERAGRGRRKLFL